MSTFLARYHDAELVLPDDVTREALEKEECSRIGRSLAVCLIAGSIPKRLGGDATDIELALDKKRSRRMAHALSRSLAGWTKKSADYMPLDDAIRSAGAAIDWRKFEAEHVTLVKSRLSLMATYAIRDGQERWGKSAVVRLENELNWVTYALRD